MQSLVMVAEPLVGIGHAAIRRLRSGWVCQHTSMRRVTVVLALGGGGGAGFRDNTANVSYDRAEVHVNQMHAPREIVETVTK